MTPSCSPKDTSSHSSPQEEPGEGRGMDTTAPRGQPLTLNSQAPTAEALSESCQGKPKVSS